MGTSPHNLSALLAMLLGPFGLLLGCGDAEIERTSDLATAHGALLAHHVPDAVGVGGAAHVLVLDRMSRMDSGTFGEDARPWGVPDFDPVAKQRENLQGGLEGLRQDTWDAFLEANSTPQDLSRIVRYSGPVVFLAEAANEDLFRDGGEEGWARFFKEHPNSRALLSMSMPGVSHDGRQALAYVERMYAWEGGSGVYYLLVREHSLWRVVAHVQVWIA